MGARPAQLGFDRVEAGEDPTGEGRDGSAGDEQTGPLGDLPVRNRPIDELCAEPERDEFLHLDEAIAALAEHDARKHEVVLLRYFAGLGMPEVAETLGLSLATVERDWTYAKAWLARRLAAQDR